MNTEAGRWIVISGLVSGFIMLSSDRRGQSFFCTQGDLVGISGLFLIAAIVILIMRGLWSSTRAIKKILQVGIAVRPAGALRSRDTQCVTLVPVQEMLW